LLTFLHDALILSKEEQTTLLKIFKQTIKDWLDGNYWKEIKGQSCQVLFSNIAQVLTMKSHYKSQVLKAIVN